MQVQKAKATQLRASLLRAHEWRWLGFTLAFSAAWEIAQLPLYDLSASRTSVAYALAHCTAGDGIIAIAAYVSAAIATGSREWVFRRPWFGTVVVILVALVYTVFSEWRNVYWLGSWAYRSEMPRVLGIGVAPLLQWVVVPVLTLGAARGRGRRDARQRNCNVPRGAGSASMIWDMFK